MSLTKNIGTLIVATLLGFLTFLFAGPKKITKSKEKPAKTSTQNPIDDKENLFI